MSLADDIVAAQGGDRPFAAAVDRYDGYISAVRAFRDEKSKGPFQSIPDYLDNRYGRFQGLSPKQGSIAFRPEKGAAIGGALGVYFASQPWFMTENGLAPSMQNAGDMFWQVA